MKLMLRCGSIRIRVTFHKRIGALLMLPLLDSQEHAFLSQAEFGPVCKQSVM